MATRTPTPRKTAEQPTAGQKAKTAAPATPAGKPRRSRAAPVSPSATAAPAPAPAADAPLARRRTAKSAAPRTAPMPEPAARASVDDDSPRKAPKRSARKPLSLELPAVSFEPSPALAVEPEAPPKAKPRARPTKPVSDEAPTPKASTPVATATARKAPAKKASAGKAPAAKAPATKPAGKKTAARKSAGRTAALPEPQAATSAPLPAPVPPPPPPPPAPPDLRPPNSAVLLDPTGRPGLLWQPGKACPAALDEAARERMNDDGLLRLDDDGALPLLIRLARDAQHELRVAPDLWVQLAWHRDALHRLHALERAYPQGPASAGLQHLLPVPLAGYQAEGALFAVCAGRALIADEPGLGKTAQGIAVAELMRRHVGIDRVLVLCADAAVPTWQREWQRFTGARATSSTRILGASALGTAGAAELVTWAPELIVVDEPQRLGAWAAIPSRHALVLCGATEDCDPALLQRIVQYLDGPRRGAAWEWLPSERQSLETAMASVALQRTREEVRAQLPALVLSARIVPMAAAQRQAHDLRAARATELLARWRRTGLLPDLDQWQLDTDVRDMQALCHRESPHAPLAEPTLAALVALIDELLPANGAASSAVAVCCPDEADLDSVTARLGERAGLSVVASVHDVPDEAAVLVRIGVPWRPMRGAPDLALWRCIHLVAEHGFDSGLYDTLDGRRDTPRGMAEEARGFLGGDRLQAYLGAVDAALRAAQAG